MPGLGNPLEMALSELGWWYNEAVKVYNEMNEVKE